MQPDGDGAVWWNFIIRTRKEGRKGGAGGGREEELGYGVTNQSGRVWKLIRGGGGGGDRVVAGHGLGIRRALVVGCKE